LERTAGRPQKRWEKYPKGFEGAENHKLYNVHQKERNRGGPLKRSKLSKN
jgi:hypothetical protein